MHHNHLILLAIVAMISTLPLRAEENTPTVPRPPVLDERSYRLAERDLLTFRVQDEPDTEVQQRIDGQGGVRVPYLGNIRIAGMTVRDAESHIEAAYIEARIFVAPQVTIRVMEYAPREVSVLGQVKNPGTVVFPIEERELGIITVISEAGGLTGIARSREIRVTRRNDAGESEVLTVNLDQLLGGDAQFQVYPGDIIFVPERFF